MADMRVKCGSNRGAVIVSCRAVLAVRGRLTCGSCAAKNSLIIKHDSVFQCLWVISSNVAQTVIQMKNQ